MDQQHGPSLTKKSSKLPLARHTYTISSASTQATTRIPEPSTGSVRKIVIKPLSEGGNQSRIARPASRIAVLSPTRLVADLETTPPSSVADFVVDDCENVAPAQLCTAKRKSRMSLSERTTETLSQIPPSPKPSRRRSSTLNSNGSMGPPTISASQLRQSRPQTPSSRQTSPVRHLPKPARVEPIYTPPRAFMRDGASRFGKPMYDNKRSISTAVTIGKPGHIQMPSLQQGKVKSLYDIRGMAAQQKALTSKPSLPSLPKHPVTPKSSCTRDHREPSPQASLMKARRPGENPISRRASEQSVTSSVHSQSANTSVKRAALETKHPGPFPNVDHLVNKPTDTGPVVSQSGNKSVSLKAFMARAKADRKAYLERPAAVERDVVTSESEATVVTEKSLSKKIRGAAFTGQLNLSAHNLTQLPAEIVRMYDSEGEVPTNWAEAVDLTKMIASDNDIEGLSDEMFPDWSDEEMLGDMTNTKNNIFRGLEILNLHNNKLSVLPIGFRRLQNLHNVNLSGNKLDDTVYSALASLSKLKELRLANNKFTGIFPSDCGFSTELQILDISNNAIDDLPDLSPLLNLRRLLLSGNRLTNIDFSRLPASIIELDFSQNDIRGDVSLDVGTQFVNIETFNISNNSIVSISNLMLPSLSSLQIHDNRIVTLPDLSACQNLRTLTASNNKLSSMPSLAGLDKLRHLDLSMNSVKSLSMDLVNLPNLTGFNIAGNPLIQKKHLTMNIDDIRLDLARKADAPNFETSTTDNAVPALCDESPIPSTVDKILFQPKNGILDLSCRTLTTIDSQQISFDSSTPIHTLRLHSNDLTMIPVSLLSHPSVKWSLMTLDLSHNPLHSNTYLTSPLELPRLQCLNLVSTGMNSLDSLTSNLSAPALMSLNISCHRLSGHVPWLRGWYPSLTTLLASDNWFDSIDVEGVRGLEVLDVSNNHITQLPPRLGLLGNLSGKRDVGRLRVLECSGNEFRVPRRQVVERGTDAVLRDLRRMVPTEEMSEEWLSEA